MVVQNVVVCVDRTSLHSNQRNLPLDHIEYVFLHCLLYGDWIHITLQQDGVQHVWGYSQLHKVQRLTDFLDNNEMQAMSNKPMHFCRTTSLKIFKSAFQKDLPVFSQFSWTINDVVYPVTQEFRLSQIEKAIEKRLTLYDKETITADDVYIQTTEDLQMETIVRMLLFHYSQLPKDMLWKLESKILIKQVNTCFSCKLFQHRRGYVSIPFEESLPLLKYRYCSLMNGVAYINLCQASYILISVLRRLPNIPKLSSDLSQFKWAGLLIRNTLYKPISIQPTNYQEPPCVQKMMKHINHKKNETRYYLNNHSRFLLTNYLVQNGHTRQYIESLFEKRTKIVYEGSDIKNHLDETKYQITRLTRPTVKYTQSCYSMRNWCPFYRNSVVTAQQACGCTSPNEYRAPDF